MPAARVGGALVCAGATMTCLLGMSNPTYSNGKPSDVIVPSIIGFFFGLSCLLAGRRSPAWMVALMPLVAAALIGSSMWLTDTPLDGSELLFVWCVFFAGYYLSTWPALGNTLAMAVGYAVVVINLRGPTVGIPPAIYLTTTLIVAWALMSMLRRWAMSSVDEARAEARTDALTGLLNLRGLTETTMREIERANRDTRPLSAWMVDLDHFKRLNDAFGHATGDRALQAIADVLRGELRGIDVIARVGGEEFCVLLPNCTASDAFRRAESVRVAVAREFAMETMPLTISIGVAEWQPGDADGRVVREAADHALYAAKSAGRNRTQVASPLDLVRAEVPRQR